MRHLRDLEENFGEHVDAYRKKKAIELVAGGRLELRRELDHTERYLQGCRRLEIAEVEINMRFDAAKIDVLRALLSGAGEIETP